MTQPLLQSKGTNGIPNNTRIIKAGIACSSGRKTCLYKYTRLIKMTELGEPYLSPNVCRLPRPCSHGHGTLRPRSRTHLRVCRLAPAHWTSPPHQLERRVAGHEQILRCTEAHETVHLVLSVTEIYQISSGNGNILRTVLNRYIVAQKILLKSRQ